MLAGISSNTLAAVFSTFIGSGERFCRWWLREFLSLFSPKTRQWLTGSSGKILLASDDGAFIELQLRSEVGTSYAVMRIATADYSAASIDDFLHAHHLRRSDLSIGLALPTKNFFTRRLVLPLQAARSLNEIVSNDLLQKTPFKLADIFHGYSATEGDGKLIVQQWLIQRERLEAAAASLRLDTSAISFVGPTEDLATSHNAAIYLTPKRPNQQLWIHRAMAGLFVSAFLLAASAGTIKYSRQQTELDQLAAQIAIAKREAQNVRSMFAKLEHKHAAIVRLRAKKSESASLLFVWEEMTRLLPADSWLTEFRMAEITKTQEYKITITGLSEGAARLVERVDASPLFREAALTTAIVLDPIEHRERFSLQTKTRKTLPQVRTP